MNKLLILFQTMHPPLAQTKYRSRTNPFPHLIKHPTYVLSAVSVVLLLDKSMYNLNMTNINGRNMQLCLMQQITYYTTNTGCLQKNGAVSKGNKEFISHLKRAQRTPSAVETVQLSHALPAVRFSCLMRGSGASFQDGVAAGKGFLCAPFLGVQICDYSAA